jgi:hypothetical protein
MELTGYLGLQSTREALWEAIFETETWKRVVPDAESYEKIEDNTYEMVVKINLAVFKGTQTLKMIFEESIELISSNFTIENSMIKKATGAFEIKHPDEAPIADNEEGYPEGTLSVLGYRLELDAGNPIFNAALEGFKGKIKEGLEEILLRLDDKE